MYTCIEFYKHKQHASYTDIDSCLICFAPSLINICDNADELSSKFIEDNGKATIEEKNNLLLMNSKFRLEVNMRQKANILMFKKIYEELFPIFEQIKYYKFDDSNKYIENIIQHMPTLVKMNLDDLFE